MTKTQQNDVRSWLHTVLDANARFFGSGGRNTRINNWNTWRLAERLFAATLLADSGEIETTRNLITAQANDNLAPSDGWSPSSGSP